MDDPPRASFLTPLLAALIDIAALWLIGIGTSKIGEHALQRQQIYTRQPSVMKNLSVWLTLIILPPMLVLAYTSTEIFYFATFGKWLLKLRVASDAGARAPTSRLIFR